MPTESDAPTRRFGVLALLAANLLALIPLAVIAAAVLWTLVLLIDRL